LRGPWEAVSCQADVAHGALVSVVAGGAAGGLSLDAEARDEVTDGDDTIRECANRRGTLSI
jgi:hypothetical protein